MAMSHAHDHEPLPDVVTDRAKKREQEDHDFVPVVVKRSDEARRHPDDTLQKSVTEGLEQTQRGSVSLAISALAGGMILGFTAMAVGVTAEAATFIKFPLAGRMLTALVYPLGFVICILSGAQLFTEHTALVVYPVLDKKASILQLLRVWITVIAGNLAGAALIALLLTATEPIVGARDGYILVGRHLVDQPLLPLLTSATLAGWLMAQGAWLVLAMPAATGQMLSVYIVTFLIGVGNLHHSIAGAVEMFLALMASKEFTINQAAVFISAALFGNLVGGSVFVAILNYAYIRRTQAIG